MSEGTGGSLTVPSGETMDGEGLQGAGLLVESLSRGSSEQKPGREGPGAGLLVESRGGGSSEEKPRREGLGKELLCELDWDYGEYSRLARAFSPGTSPTGPA